MRNKICFTLCYNSWTVFRTKCKYIALRLNSFYVHEDKSGVKIRVRRMLRYRSTEFPLAGFFGRLSGVWTMKSTSMFKSALRFVFSCDERVFVRLRGDTFLSNDFFFSFLIVKECVGAWPSHCGVTHLKLRKENCLHSLQCKHIQNELSNPVGVHTAVLIMVMMINTAV